MNKKELEAFAREAAKSIKTVSISVENFPPVSVQKFPHGLVG